VPSLKLDSLGFMLSPKLDSLGFMLSPKLESLETERLIVF
jgi:hypothetical protein